MTIVVWSVWVEGFTGVTGQEVGAGRYLRAAQARKLFTGLFGGGEFGCDALDA